MSAEFRGTRYYVAWGVAERGPLFRLRSFGTRSGLYPTLFVAGARYAQRCPVEFGVPMEVVIAA
jgi:hypothetical protein